MPQHFVGCLHVGTVQQVILVIEEALKRMKVTDVERKVTLETLNYCHIQQQQRLAAAETGQANGLDSAEPSEADDQERQAKPFTQ